MDNLEYFEYVWVLRILTNAKENGLKLGVNFDFNSRNLIGSKYRYFIR